MFIDVHCHLGFLEKEGLSIEKAVKNAVKNNVKIIVVNGVNTENNLEIMKLSERFDEIKFSAGMYPVDALKLSDGQINDGIKLIKKNKDKIIAIGEIGLDLKDKNTEENWEKQKRVFSKFVNLAILLDKPVIVHSRKAELQTIELLEKLGAKKVVMHCFSGKMKLVDRIAGNGWFLSIPANVKYSQQFQEVVKRIEIENLLCETDSPYLHPDKKWPNEPANVIESYKKIAEIKKISLKEAERKIEENFRNVFDSK